MIRKVELLRIAMNKQNVLTYDFPDSKCLVVCGDIHGDFNMLVNKVCVQYGLKDTVVIVAGDCGFGFDPAYFDGKTIAYKRFMAIPDYSVVKANGHTSLCVGGAISIDRQYRISAWNRNVMNQLRFGHIMNDKDPLAPNYYWKDEMPVFNEELLSQILAEHPVDDGSGLIVPPKTVSNVPPAAETNVPPSVASSRSFFCKHSANPVSTFKGIQRL